MSTAREAAGADAPAEHVTPYDRLALDDREAEQLLARGTHRGELEAFFGEREYRELAQLAHAAHRRPLHRGAPRVLLVPGVMGTQLGMARRAPLPNDVLWLDPVDIGAGRLRALTMREPSAVRPLGVVLFSYLRLKLRLRAAGMSPLVHVYDWRCDLEVLGRELAALIEQQPLVPLMVVGHSMGGLVARAALALPAGERVQRVVLLGTPNTGSYAPVQALRGTYAVVRKIARLDHIHSAETLAGEVFRTFPSLYQMLPWRRSDGLDLYDSAAWPHTGPQPDPTLLARARTVQKLLAPADPRFTAVVGVGQETVTAIARRREEFLYTVSRQGDGTVPRDRAELPGATTYYAAVSHSDLTRSDAVAAAVADVLRRGHTTRLPTRASRRARAIARVGDRALRRSHAGKVDWGALTPEQRREFLQNLNEPPHLVLRVPGPTRSRAVRSVPAGSRRRTRRRG